MSVTTTRFPLEERPADDADLPRAALHQMVRFLDQNIDEAHDRGAVSLVDAVDLRDMCRAALAGAPRFTTDVSRVTMRMERIAMGKISACSSGVGWVTAPSPPSGSDR